MTRHITIPAADVQGLYARLMLASARATAAAMLKRGIKDRLAAPETRKHRAGRREVLRVLLAAKRPMTSQDIAARVGVSDSTVRGILDRMVEAGLVTVHRGKRRKDPQTFSAVRDVKQGAST